jgi:hypothetical protein
VQVASAFSHILNLHNLSENVVSSDMVRNSAFQTRPMHQIVSECDVFEAVYGVCVRHHVYARQLTAPAHLSASDVSRCPHPAAMRESELCCSIAMASIWNRR